MVEWLELVIKILFQIYQILRCHQNNQEKYQIEVKLADSLGAFSTYTFNIVLHASSAKN